MLICRGGQRGSEASIGRRISVATLKQDFSLYVQFTTRKHEDIVDKSA